MNIETILKEVIADTHFILLLNSNNTFAFDLY